MSDVFISYSRADFIFADKLALELERIYGRESVWIDRHSLDPTVEWWQAIKSGIESANNFVLIMSPDSLSSPICHLEIEYAQQLGKRLIPLNHRTITHDAAAEAMMKRIAKDAYVSQILGDRNPMSLFNKTWLTISHYNHIFFQYDPAKSEKFRTGQAETPQERAEREAEEAEFTNQFPKLKSGLELDIVHVRQHTRFTQRSREWDENKRAEALLLVRDEVVSAEAWLAAWQRDTSERAAQISPLPPKLPEPTNLQREFIAASRKVENRRRRQALLNLVAIVVLLFAAIIAGVLTVVAGQQQAASVAQAATSDSAAANAAAQVATLQPIIASAETQIAGVEPTLDGAETQIAGVAPTLIEARTQIALANSALTPIPLTLTPAYLTLQAADAFAATAQRDAILLGQTLTPIPRTLAYSEISIMLAQTDIYSANAAAATAAIQATTANENILEARTQVAAGNATLAPLAITLNAAETRVAGVEPTLESAARQVAGVEPTLAEAQAQIRSANAALTPIPLTLTPAYLTLQAAETRIAGVEPTLESAARQIAGVEPTLAEAQAQIRSANAALTPIPLTLTPAYLTLQAADSFAATAQRDMSIFSKTLTPIPLTLAYSETSIFVAQIDIQDANDAAATAALQATIANDTVIEARRDVVASNSTLTPIAGTLAAAETLVAGVDPTLQSAASQVAGVQPTLDSAGTRVAGVEPTLNQAGTQIAAVNPTLTGVALEIFQQQAIAESLRLAASAEQLLDAGNPDVALALALKAYELNHSLPQVQRVLNALRPFTPRYVTSIGASNRITALITSQSITYAAFSPDGTSIAIPEGNRQVIIRDLTSRRIIFTLNLPGTTSVLRYSSSGKYLAIGTADGVVVFEPLTGFERMRIANAATITALEFSRDERYLIVGFNRNGAQVWDVEAQTQSLTLNTPPNGGRLYSIIDVAFNNNATEAYAYDGSQLNIGNMQSGQVRFALVGNIRGVSPGMNYGVVGGAGNSFVSLWNPITYSPLREFRLSNFDTDYLMNIAFSEDRRFVFVHLESRFFHDTIRNRYTVTARRIEYWRVEDGARVATMQTPDLSPLVWNVSAMSISDDGRYGITGGIYGAVPSASVWDLQTGEELRRFEGHSSSIVAVDFSPNNTAVYTLSRGDLKVWDLGDPRSSAHMQFFPNVNQIAQMAFSHDQSELFLAYNDQALGRWSLSTQQQDASRGVQTGAQVSIAFSPVEPLALVASMESLTLWDMNTREFRYRIPGIQAENVRDMRFSSDGRFVYFLEGGTLWRWNVQANTGEQIRGVRSATQFSIDNLNELVLTLSSNSLDLTDMIDHRTVMSYEGFSGGALAVDLSSGADWVIAGTGEPDNAVMIWDARTGRRIFDLRAHTQPVTAVAFSPDGRLAVSGSVDTALVLWDVTTGQVLQTFRGHTAAIREIVFAPDGRTFATRSDNVEDGILIWHAETGQETIDWMYANRNIVDLTCDQRVQFNITPACLEGGIAPSATPSLTPVPTSGPTATSTPRPTATITLTPLPRVQVITDERIVLRRGYEGEAYTYRDGTADPGEFVTILEMRTDIGWVRVRTDSGEVGWTRLNYLAWR